MSALTTWIAKNFLSPRARALSEERIQALRAVREARTAGELIGEGGNAAAFKVGDKIVKHGDGPWWGEEAKRRGFLDHELEKLGVTPRTFLVETRGQKYLVQPRGKVPGYRHSHWKTMEDAENAAGAIQDKIYEAGFMPRSGQFGYDIGGHNMAKMPDGSWKLIDTGMVNAPRPTDRAGALEKFISYGKRAKPWLDE